MATILRPIPLQTLTCTAATTRRPCLLAHTCCAHVVAQTSASTTPPDCCQAALVRAHQLQGLGCGWCLDQRHNHHRCFSPSSTRLRLISSAMRKNSSIASPILDSNTLCGPSLRSVSSQRQAVSMAHPRVLARLTYLNNGSSSPKSVRVTAVSRISVGLAGGACNLTISHEGMCLCVSPASTALAGHRTCQGTLETFAGYAGTCDWVAWCPDHTRACTLSAPMCETSNHLHGCSDSVPPAQSIPTMGCTSHSRRAAWHDVVPWF